MAISCSRKGWLAQHPPLEAVARSAHPVRWSLTADHMLLRASTAVPYLCFQRQGASANPPIDYRSSDSDPYIAYPPQCLWPCKTAWLRGLKWLRWLKLTRQHG